MSESVTSSPSSYRDFFAKLYGPIEEDKQSKQNVKINFGLDDKNIQDVNKNTNLDDKNNQDVNKNTNFDDKNNVMLLCSTLLLNFHFFKSKTL
jgi:hypothetical protein